MNQDALSEIGVESPVAEEAARPQSSLRPTASMHRVLADGGSRHVSCWVPDALIVTPGASGGCRPW